MCINPHLQCIRERAESDWAGGVKVYVYRANGGVG